MRTPVYQNFLRQDKAVPPYGVTPHVSTQSYVPHLEGVWNKCGHTIRRRMRRIWPLVLLGSLASLTGLFWFAGFRVNLTPSLPLGIYRVSHNPITHGGLVVVCLPSEIAQQGRRYLLPGSCPSNTRPVLKIARALAGDVLELRPEAVIVNGTPLPHSATATVDSTVRKWGTSRDGNWCSSAWPRTD